MTSQYTEDAAQALAWSDELFGDASPLAFLLAPARFASATRRDGSLAVTLGEDGSVGLTMGPHPVMNPRWTHCVVDNGVAGDEASTFTSRDEWDFFTIRTHASAENSRVRVLDDDELVTRILDEHAPQSQVWPANPEIVHWYATSDERGDVASLAVVVRWESGYHVVSSVTTVRDQRGRGYARLLMRGVVAATHAAGIEWLGLGVRHDNHVAQNVYRDVGFTLRARFTSYRTG